ncbi:hypothetical protein GALMADRAFT_834916 [Galerina marginata CBS 339.88]|uniref:Uncharacterized protein n=1 Tax=Galerina marginata (strain CBS 339.88) TaxID=685588 RepID=A0A067THJ7_GALM3|nr:hypothetical protein GALMADRAFT_834916 [Galerina marginata CBS 339.88]
MYHSKLYMYFSFSVLPLSFPVFFSCSVTSPFSHSLSLLCTGYLLTLTQSDSHNRAIHLLYPLPRPRIPPTHACMFCSPPTVLYCPLSFLSLATHLSLTAQSALHTRTFLSI